MLVPRPALACSLALALQPSCVIDELEDDDVGDASFCDAASPWPRDYAELEADLLDRLATLRRQGRTCGEVRHNPVAALRLQPQLHCAARLHATWIAEHEGLPHEGQGGTTPLSRAALAGYDGALRYELLARDFEGPGAVLRAWLDEPAHCDALFDRRVQEIGVGHSRSDPGTPGSRGGPDGIGWVVVLGEREPE